MRPRGSEGSPAARMDAPLLTLCLDQLCRAGPRLAVLMFEGGHSQMWGAGRRLGQPTAPSGGRGSGVKQHHCLFPRNVLGGRGGGPRGRGVSRRGTLRCLTPSRNWGAAGLWGTSVGDGGQQLLPCEGCTACAGPRREGEAARDVEPRGARAVMYTVGWVAYLVLRV